MAELDIEKIGETIGNRDAVMNMQGLTFVDSSGIIFFLKIQRLLSQRDRSCVLYGMNANIRQMFHITRLLQFFLIAADRAKAMLLLEEREKEEL